MRKPTPACPLFASEWYSRWPLWSGETFLRTSPSPITSHCMLFSFSSSNLFTCSSFSITLCVAIFTHLVVVLLDPEIYNTSAYVGLYRSSLADSNQRPGHIHPCYWGVGPRLICTLHTVFHGLPFLIGQCWLERNTATCLCHSPHLVCRNCLHLYLSIVLSRLHKP